MPLFGIIVLDIFGIIVLDLLGLLGSWIQIRNTIKEWWDAQGNSRLRVIFHDMPNIILWFLWEKRHIIFHGG